MQNSFIGLWLRLLLSPGGATAHRHRRALLCLIITSRQLIGSSLLSLCEEMTRYLIALRAARMRLEVRNLEILESFLEEAIRASQGLNMIRLREFARSRLRSVKLVRLTYFAVRAIRLS